MIGAQHHYNPVEKECLAFFFHPEDATLYSGPDYSRHLKVNPLRFLMIKPSLLNSRLAKWAILLSQYEMQFLPQKAIKGQVVIDFLAEHPDPRTTKLYNNLPDEIAEVYLTQTSFERQVWQFFFDDASRTSPEEIS